MHQYTNHIVHCMKELKNKGLCYHPLAPGECNSIYIRAHSIQYSGLLKLIEENNEVYSYDLSYSNLIKNNGNVDFKPVKIKEISTFRGFCQIHDNKLFEPIDNSSFNSSQEHAFLYAYRALCKTMFSVKNAIKMAEEYEKLYGKNEVTIDHLKSNISNYNNLLFHKKLYDKCLIENDYSEIYYVAFIMESDPNILFSTSVFPVVDFNGDIVQLIEDDIAPSLLSINSVPFNDNWIYLISWHEYSNFHVSNFLISLDRVMNSNNNISDYLFRLIITSENVALSAKWLRGLSVEENSMLKKYVNSKFSGNKIFNFNYLSEGVEGISKWEYGTVFSDNFPKDIS